MKIEIRIYIVLESEIETDLEIEFQWEICGMYVDECIKCILLKKENSGNVGRT